MERRGHHERPGQHPEREHPALDRRWFDLSHRPDHEHSQRRLTTCRAAEPHHFNRPPESRSCGQHLLRHWQRQLRHGFHDAGAVDHLDSTALVAENCSTTNGVIDPGETVTLNISLRNTGTADTTNLVVTLLATNGVVSPSAAQNYGVLVAGGAAVTRSFTFSAAGVCSGNLSTVLHLVDSPSDYGNLSRTFSLGVMVPSTWRYTNSTTLTIPGTGTKGPMSPFPSSIAVSGVTGAVSKVTLTLAGLSHTWPADVDALLVGPTGQTLLFLSDAGGGNAVSGLNLTFDDAASSALSDSAAMTSGTYRCTNYGSGDTFSAPAPAGSYGTTLSVFNGLNANGTWSLYIQDDSSQDTGSIAQGWSLSVTTSNAICCVTPTPVADLAIQKTASVSAVNAGANVNFTLTVTNHGPEVADLLTIDDFLPAGLNFVSASSAYGPWTNVGQQVEFIVTNLASGSAISVGVVATASSPGNRTNVATVAANTLDPVSSNNLASVVISVNAFPTISDITNLVTNEDFDAGPLAFSIGDFETPAGSLALTASSSDTNLVPLANVVFGGSGSNRTVTVTPAPNAFGSATITVSVNDGMATNTDSFLLTFNPVNDPPTLAAITNFTIVEGGTLTFTNVANDVETPANLLVFTLTGAPTNAAINPTNGVFTWITGELDGPSTNSIFVTVTDDAAPSLSATQSFTVIVLETNEAPVLAAISNFTIFEGETLTFTNVATDSDSPSNALVFSLASAPAGASVNLTNGVFTWTTTEADGPGTNVIAVVVTDDGTPSLSATQSFTVTVLETNAVPVLAGISNFTLVEGELLTFTNSASDSDLPANALTFALENAPTNATVNPTNGVFTWTPSEAQGPSTNTISVIVTDNPGQPGSLSATQSFTVIVLETNEAPVLAAIGDYTIFEGTKLTITNLASDADLPANALLFSLADAPTNATINPTNGVLCWTPTEAQGPSTNHISVIVTDDGVPSLSATQSFTVIVLETNEAPVLAAISNYTVFEGATLIFTNTATDSDSPPNALVFSLASAPTNATLNPTNGVFCWKPTEAQGPSTNLISVVVSDDGAPSLSATQSFTVIVLESNTAPVLAPISDHKIHAGRTLTLTNSATDSDLPPNTLTFSLDAGAPPGATITADSGVLTWTPSDADTSAVHSFTVRVTDDGVPALSDTKTFLVTVVSRPFITSLEITNGLATVTWTSLAGQDYRLQYLTNLNDTNWSDVAPDVTATGPTATQTNAFDPASLRFYRVKLVP
ncbi:MAG: DUF11 domain-containing protein [Pedosphaera sp.]|nr:DUF11 domain-containing protein [Pedosphaera sp.]